MLIEVTNSYHFSLTRMHRFKKSNTAVEVVKELELHTAGESGKWYKHFEGLPGIFNGITK